MQFTNMTHLESLCIDGAKLIWKKVFSDVLHSELIPKTKYIWKCFSDDDYYDYTYCIKIMENTMHYEYIHFYDTSWGLGLGFGNKVSNIDAILNFKELALM